MKHQGIASVCIHNINLRNTIDSQNKFGKPLQQLDGPLDQMQATFPTGVMLKDLHLEIFVQMAQAAFSSY